MTPKTILFEAHNGVATLTFNRPEVLNATNGKKAAGAVFSFDQSLGDDGVLKPGMLSGPVPMRLKLMDPQRTPGIQFKIFGQIDKQ